MILPATANSGVVVDTDVASFLFNQDPARAPRYQTHTQGRSLYLSFATVAELLFGAEIRGWGGARKARLDAYLQQFTPVYPDRAVCHTWAAIRAHCQQRGRTIERQDAWVAATAVNLGLPLITHNAAHCQNVPLLAVITSQDR